MNKHENECTIVTQIKTVAGYCRIRSVGSQTVTYDLSWISKFEEQKKKNFNWSKCNTELTEAETIHLIQNKEIS